MLQRPRIAVVRPDPLQAGQALAHRVEDQPRASAIRDIGGMDHHAEHVPLGVDQDVPLTPKQFRGPIEAAQPAPQCLDRLDAR